MVLCTILAEKDVLQGAAFSVVMQNRASMATHVPGRLDYVMAQEERVWQACGRPP